MLLASRHSAGSYLLEIPSPRELSPYSHSEVVLATCCFHRVADFKGESCSVYELTLNLPHFHIILLLKAAFWSRYRAKSKELIGWEGCEVWLMVGRPGRDCVCDTLLHQVSFFGGEFGNSMWGSV